MVVCVKESRFASGLQGPGPAAYKLPTSVGYDFKSNPNCLYAPTKIDRKVPNSFSFGIRGNQRAYVVTPGPAAAKVPYNFPMPTHHGKVQSNKYTLGSKYAANPYVVTPAACDTQPDPGKYRPEDFEKLRRAQGLAAPRYTMSSRHRANPFVVTPAPNTYFEVDKATGCIPDISSRVKPRAPKYTMSSRVPNCPYVVTPSPGKYSPFEKNLNLIAPKAPQWSVPKGQRGGRDSKVSPGPGAYNLQNVKGITGKDKSTAVSGKKGPSYHMGKRTNRAPMVIDADFC